SGLHADQSRLLAYWLGELDDTEEGALEEHYLGCELCAAELGEIEALASGVRGAFANGRVATVLTPAFVDQLRSGGVRVREYTVPRNGSVNCTLAPEDQLLIGRLQLPEMDTGRVDAIVTAAGQDFRLEDVPFDAASGELVMAPSIALF